MPTITTYIDRARGVWYVNAYWPGHPPRRIRESLGVPATEDPAGPLAQWTARVLPLHESAADVPAPVTRTQGGLLRDVATWYLDTYLPYAGSSKKTIEYYTSTLWNFIGYCASRHVARTGQLSARIIQEWQMSTRAAPSREQVLQVRRWLRVADEQGIIPELPEIKWLIPGKKRSVQHVAHEPAVIAAWLEALCLYRPQAGLVARWVDATGWRIGDALDLRVAEVDLVRGTIQRHQLKTASRLPYPITPALRALLDTALARHPGAPEGHVFLNHKRQPWAYPALYRVLESFHGNYPTAITFRDLRKSFGTNLAMQGCPPNVLKELMGHSDIAMTLGYYVDVDMGRMAEWSVRHTDPVSARVSAAE